MEREVQHLQSAMASSDGVRLLDTRPLVLNPENALKPATGQARGEIEIPGNVRVHDNDETGF